MFRLPLFLLVLAAAASAAHGGTFTTIEALEYARPGGEPLLLDLRLPDGPGPHPVIVYLHSGAWVTGDRTGGPAIRQASRGYAVASIDYRLAPKHVWPAQAEDTKAAIRWLRANAARFGLDPERIGIFGASAGGHIGSVAGTSAGVEELEGIGLGNPQYSSSVRAVVDYFGPVDLSLLEEQKIPCIPLDGNALWMPPSLLLGCGVQQCPDRVQSANPITWITPGDPPFLIVQGKLDCLVSWKQSAMLHEALLAGGVRSRLILLPDGQHGGSAFDRVEVRAAVDRFLDRNLRGVSILRKQRAVRRR